MNKRHYEHTLPNIRGSLSNTYCSDGMGTYCDKHSDFMVSPLKWSALFIVVNKSAHLGEQTCSPKWAVHESLY